MPSSNIKGGYCLVPGTSPIRSADASHARWLADHVVARCPINGAGCRCTSLIDSRKQPMSAADSGVACTTLFVQRFTLSFANGHIFQMVHGRSLSVSDQYWTANSEVANFTELLHPAVWPQ